MLVIGQFCGDGPHSLPMPAGERTLPRVLQSVGGDLVSDCVLRLKVAIDFRKFVPEWEIVVIDVAGVPSHRLL